MNNVALITNPIQKEWTIDFTRAKILADHYIELWNYNRPNKEKITETLKEYYYELIRIARSQFSNKLKIYDKDTERYNNLVTGDVKIFVNNVHLGQKRKRHESTIYRRNKRLIKAGLLKKIFHGSNRNYELILNPYIVFPLEKNLLKEAPEIYQLSQNLPSFLNTSKFAFCNHKSVSILSHLNKEVIEAEYQILFRNQKDNSLNFEFKGIHSIKEFDTFIFSLHKAFNLATQKTETQSDLKAEKQETEPISPPVSAAPPSTLNIQPHNLNTSTVTDKTKISADNSINSVRSGGLNKKFQELVSKHPLNRYKTKDIRELRLIYANVLYSFALDRIHGWKDRVYENAAAEVVFYIADHYFANCRYKSELESKLLYYQKAIEIAARYIRKKIINKKWQNYWCFPATYFDVQYKNGFRRACEIASEHIKKKQKEKYNKRRLNVNQKFNAILIEYYTSESDNYYMLLQKVKETIPSRVNQFKYCIKNKIQNVDNYWNEKKQTACN